MKIFITGGTGFIGKVVVNRLQRSGHQLLVLTQRKMSAAHLFDSAKGIQLVRGSLANLKKLEPIIRRFRPAVTIHLAWEGIPDYGLSMSTKNLVYGINLIELVARLGCQTFVGAGSCWEYGTAVGKTSEASQLQPANHAGAAKLAIQLFGERIAAQHGMKFIWTRFFYVYGPGQKSLSLIPSLIGQARQGKPLTLNNPAGGNDFVYVDDVAEAVALIVKQHKTIPAGAYNIGSGRLNSVRQIADLVSKSFKLVTKSKVPKRPPVGFYASINKLYKTTGWRPRVNLEQGVKRTISYFQAI